MSEDPWYKDGLPFSCTQCGKCCTGEPGYVFVDEQEMVAMAKFLGITNEEFRRKYVRKIFFRYSLKENPQNFDCVFLKDKQCQVYAARPKKCRTFPFWPEYLTSPKSWKEAKDRCEGIHPDAEIIPLEEIQKKLREE